MEPINNIEDTFRSCLFLSNYKNLCVEDQKELLIAKQIYLLDRDNYLDTVSILYNDEPYKPYIAEDAFDMGKRFLYLDEKYNINSLLLEEIFRYIKDDVEGSMHQPLNIAIKDIELHAGHLEHFSDVNEFYKANYKNQYDKIIKNENFFTYNEPTAWNYPDWDYFVTQEISSNKSMIETHLFCEIGYSSFEEIALSWQDLYYHTEVMTFLREKIKGSNDASLSKLIFKDNGEEVFNHIVITYEGKKSQAFFNYLYYFLLDNLKKLKLEDEHSNTYKSYVIKKGYLKQYGRMQRTRATNKKTHTKMMNLFQETYSEKFEQTMSKDE
jgi:hypothetical protein